MEKVLELIRQSAGAFLYIFINSDANLNRTIMEKRERQITLLRRIATSADITYWKAEQAVRDGIFAVFGKEPDEILAHLYSNTGIGNTATPASEPNVWDNIGNFLNSVNNLLRTVNNNNNQNQNRPPANTFPSQNDWNRSPNWMVWLPVGVTLGIVGWLFFSSRK